MTRVHMLVVWLTVLCATSAAQAQTTWRDPSSHQTRLVTVDDGVDLEVLDWGGNGQPIVLLAGLGNTAHVFDDIAPKLARAGHVYGITRRGYGGSSRPQAGYDVERLGLDLLAVLDRLNLSKTVLVGHSIGGQELSYLGSKHPDRVAGLIYLDAAYRYAFFRPGVQENLTTLRNNLELLDAELKKGPREPAEFSKTIRTLLGDSVTEFQKDIEQLTTTPPLPPAGAPRPTAADLASFEAYRKFGVRVQGYALPEAELRQLSAVTPTGGVGERTTPASVGQAVSAGSGRFTQIAVPTLAIFASPHDLGPWTRSDAAMRTAFEAFAKFDQGMTERQAYAFERGVAGARVVRIPNASHHLFVTHEDQVLKEMTAFIQSLVRP
jgi:non-heme chloroperoxidase